jgi:hypothetical protein
MKFTAKFLLLLTICFIASNITHVHATAIKEKWEKMDKLRRLSMESEDDKAVELNKEASKLDKEVYEELVKISNGNREKLRTLLKEDTSSQVVLVSIGSYVEREEDKNNESRDWEFQLQPYFFMQAAKNYPQNKFTIIAIDPFFAQEDYGIQTEKKDNLTIIKVPTCIFTSYQKAFKNEEAKNEKEIFDGDVSALKDYIQGVFGRKGAFVIADFANAMHKPVVEELGKTMTFTGELCSETLPIDTKKYTTFGSTDARFFCYDFASVDEKSGEICNFLQIIKTKEEQFKIFDPRYANLVGDVQWHDKK